MGLGLFVVASSVSILGAVTEKVLESIGKEEVASKVSLVTKVTLGVTITVCALKLIKECAKLLQM
jgi:hypothetical protein